MKYPKSRKPFLLIVSLVFFILLIIGIIALFVIAIFGLLHSAWWIFIIIVYLSSNMLLTQIIVSSEYNRHSIITWCIIIYGIPLVGGAIYVIFGKIPITRYSKLKDIKVERGQLLNYSSKNKNSKLNIIDKHIKRQSYKNSSIRLVSASEKFSELFIKLENAKSYIHMEYYIFRQGEIFNDLYEILYQKIKEGVEVRIIVDDVGSANVKSSEFIKWKEAGIQISKFNKIRPPFLSGYVNFRMHRKIIIIDGIYGFLGGTNIGDEYVGMSARYGDWLDLHIVLEGEVIDGLSKSFLLDWKYSTKENLINEEKYKSVKSYIVSKDVIKIIEDGADVDVSTFENIFMDLTKQATKRVWISTPYTIIPRKMSKTIVSMARSGIDVKIFVPGRYDWILPHKAGNFYLKKLIDNKIEVYQTNNIFLHSKAIIWDDNLSMIGTSNLDFRSFYLNFEINAFIESKEMNKSLDTYFNDLIKISNKNKPSYKSHYPWNWITNLFYWVVAPFL